MKRKMPQLIELLPNDDTTSRRLLVIKVSDCNVVFVTDSGVIRDVMVYQVEMTDKGLLQSDLDGLLGKAFNLLMGSIWCDI